MDRAKEMSATGELKHVMLAFRWGNYLEVARRRANDRKSVVEFSDALIATVGELEKLGLKVSVLLEVPIFEKSVPKTVALHHWRGLPLPHLSKQQHIERLEIYSPLIQRLQAETPHVSLIDAAPYFISKDGSIEYMDEQGLLLYRDEHHLTEHGSMRLKPLFEKLLLN